MAQVARAHTEAAGGPEKLKRLSVQFRGLGRLGEEIIVTCTVRGVSDGTAIIDSHAVQSGRGIIRDAVGELSL